MIGGTEVICGMLLAGFPSRESIIIVFVNYKMFINFTLLDKVKNAANVTLLILMMLAIYSQYVVSDAFERIGPTMVFSFMLIGRLVIYYQVL